MEHENKVPEGEPKLSKKQLKKLEKKRKKEEARKAREQEKREADAKIAAEYSHIFGVSPLNKSESREGRTFSHIKDLSKDNEGDNLLFSGRVDNVRGKGNACFLVLRQRVSTLQCVAFKSETVPKPLIKFVQSIPTESIVQIEGKLVEPEEKIASCTFKDLELQVSKIFVVSKAESLPILVSDCAISEAMIKSQEEEQAEAEKKLKELLERKANGEEGLDEEIKEFEAKSRGKKYNPVGQLLRLNNRIIDLRTRANNAIFRVAGGIQLLFREFLTSKDFVEIHSPKLLGAASEGGAEFFKVEYFDRSAFLAQSPQFYKQMAIAADFGAVFEIGPVFRAENSNTHRHLCEFVGADLEMQFNEHYHEVTDVIGQMFCYIFDNVPKRYAVELEAIQDQFPFKPLRYSNPPLRFEWPEIITLLREAGEEIGDLEDVGTSQEKLLGKIIAEKHGLDFYWVDKFPSTIRPFYTMLDPKNPDYTNSYDWFVRGEEITSGAQRIHDPEYLTERVKHHGIDPETIKSYIDSFRYGCPPHAGCGIGLERLVMLYLGLPNIRRTSLFPRDPHRLHP